MDTKKTHSKIDDAAEKVRGIAAKAVDKGQEAAKAGLDAAGALAE